MKTFTAEETERLSKFITDHSKKARERMLLIGFKSTALSIIEFGHFTCRTDFMDFPDYDETIPLELADSILILYHDYVTDDFTFSELYDYISNNIIQCLGAITGA